MKILEVIPYFDFAYGGQVSTVYGLSKKLAEKDHEVYICTTDMKKDEESLKDNEKINLDNEKIKILYFRCSNYWIGNNLKLIFSSEMRKYIKNNLNYFDVVHIHEIRGIPPLYIWYYARKYGKKYVLQAHGAAPIRYPNQSIMLIIFKLIFHLLFGRVILRNSSKVVALNDVEKKQYVELGIPECKIEFIGNAVDLENYVNLPNKGNFRKKYSITPQEKLILYLGQIHPIKGLELLLDAFNELLDEHVDFKLVLVGPNSGNLLELKKKAQDMHIVDKVLFTGPIYGIKKLEAYIDADIYVLPSLYETFPNTVLESAACGTPIIITENCGLSTTFKKNNLGLVVKSNVKDLKNAIFKLLNDEKLKSELSLNAHKWVFENYSWEEVSLKFEKLYKKVLNYE